jgi:uncharacterized protein (UPF0333 family)
MILATLKSQSTQGQVALEYAMLIVIVMIPLAMAVRTLLGPTEKNTDVPALNQSAKPKNGMQKIVFDSYGNEKRMGIIGRPYP